MMYSETLFRDLKPLDLRKGLNNIQNDMNKLPTGMRTFAAFEHLKTTINNYLAMNAPLVELNSGKSIYSTC